MDESWSHYPSCPTNKGFTKPGDCRWCSIEEEWKLKYKETGKYCRKLEEDREGS